MRKLMSANLSRLLKDKVFWLAMVMMLCYSVMGMISGCRQATQDMSEFHYMLEHYYFDGMPFIGLFIAVFVSLFLGTEYSDGTIRNKLIAGHTRMNVYLSSFLTCAAASEQLLLMSCIGGLVGIPTLGVWEMGAKGLAVCVLVAALMTAALCAVFTFVAMLLTNRAVSAVACILLYIALVPLSAQYYNALCEPELRSSYVITAEEGLQLTEPAPNPDYVSGTKREVYEVLSDVLPISQGIRLDDLAVERPGRMMISSLLIAAGATLCGAFFFRRKDLK